MEIPIEFIEWKRDDGKKFSGFFLKTKEGYRRVGISTEVYNFPEDMKISEVVLNDVAGRLEKKKKGKW